MNNITNGTDTNSTSSVNLSLQYARTGTLLLCMTVGMFTNILFIVTISKSKGLYRRSLFGLCLNLDCVFLLDIFLNQSFTVIASIRNTWDFPDTICIAQSFSIHVVDTCLSLTLFMLGIDRLIAVRANVNNDSKRAKGLTRDSISLSILCLWLLSICFSIPLVTNTIPSKIFQDHFSCLPRFDANLIYTLSNFFLTIFVPIISVSAMYIHIAVVWTREKREMAVISSSSVTFQIENEVNNSIYTVVVHILWVIMVGPYFTWMYIPNLPTDLAAVVSWMRHFFSWIPFMAMLLYHKAFRQTFVAVFIGYKYRSSSATNPINNCPANLNTSNISQSQHTCSTNVPSNRRSVSLYGENDDDFSSITLSRASSAVSGGHVNHLPKIPILYADVYGVHVIHNNLSNCHSLSSSTREEATLCDVRQNSFTDASDAMSMTTQESVRQNNVIQRGSCDIKLPADIADMYNLDDRRARMKRIPQSRQKSFANTLETAFDTPDQSVSNIKPTISPKSTTVVAHRPHRKGVQNNFKLTSDVPEHIGSNILPRTNDLILDGPYYDNSSFVLDFIGSTNV